MSTKKGWIRRVHPHAHGLEKLGRSWMEGVLEEGEHWGGQDLMNARKQRRPSASPRWGGRTTEVNHTFSEVAAGTADIPAAQYGLVTGHQ